MRATLRFEILSYWHAGTGRGSGAQGNAVVQRDRSGLPYLPGRTVKGLVRSAAAIGLEAKLLSRDEAERWFGSRLLDDGSDRVQKLEQIRFRTKQGSLRFSSATLGRRWEDWARTSDDCPRALEPLFAILARTAIDDRGVASKRSLRTIEVTVPMTLEATAEGPDGRWPTVLAEIAPFLRTLGSERNRGLGRVQMTVEELR